MSAKNNVNKDYYTQAGRDRPNENIVHEDHKEELTQAEKRVASGAAAPPRHARSRGKKGKGPAVIGADTAQIPPLEEREAGA